MAKDLLSLIHLWGSLLVSGLMARWICMGGKKWAAGPPLTPHSSHSVMYMVILWSLISYYVLISNTFFLEPETLKNQTRPASRDTGVQAPDANGTPWCADSGTWGGQVQPWRGLKPVLKTSWHPPAVHIVKVLPYRFCIVLCFMQKTLNAKTLSQSGAFWGSWSSGAPEPTLPG